VAANSKRALKDEAGVDQSTSPATASQSTQESAEKAAASSAEGPDIATDTSAKRELFGMTLTIRNRVEGRYVERPENLCSNDRWMVEYAIEELADEQCHTLYSNLVRRRGKIFGPSGANWYLMFDGRLDQYSKRGRQFRRSENNREKAGLVHVWNSSESTRSGLGSRYQWGRGNSEKLKEDPWWPTE
jgi:hypothetical protein